MLATGLANTLRSPRLHSLEFVLTMGDTDFPLISLFWPFEQGQLQWPLEGGGLFLGAREGWPLRQRALQGLVCESNYKPDVDALQQAGITLGDADQRRYPLVLLLPGRQREQARAELARALDRLLPGGVLVVCQANDEGARSCAADLTRLAGPLQSVSKHHCRVFWTQPDAAIDAALAAEWREGDAPRPILDGRFVSRPGLFAWDRSDPASRLLAEHLPDDLAGAAADLGCGYGFLSERLLTRCAAIRSLDLYEADARALPLAVHNLAAHAESITITPHWHDVTQGLRERFDVIVCNPPFHTQRGGDRPDIGRRFIAAAAAALRPGGRLWLVANRHLPYEAELARGFASLRSVCQRDGFKVIEARRESSGVGA